MNHEILKYVTQKDGSIKKCYGDGRSTTFGQHNIEYAEYLDWVAAGGIPEPYITQQEVILREQKSKCAQIEQEYADALYADIIFLGHTFQADETTMITLTKVLTVGAVSPDFVWYDIDNIPVSMDITKLKEFAMGMFSRGQPEFVRMQQRKAAVRALTTIEAIRSYS